MRVLWTIILLICVASLVIGVWAAGVGGGIILFMVFGFPSVGLGILISSIAAKRVNR